MFDVEAQGAGFTCPCCGWTSCNPHDKRERYCGHCHVFVDDEAARRPGYWMNETSGVLKPALEAYLRDDPLDDGQIAALRAYLRQWIMAPAWKGAGVPRLRASIDGLTSRQAIHEWLAVAAELNIDPL